MIQDILNILGNRDNWLILLHEKPDGDTIGCGVAILRLGTRISKRVRMACPDPCPARYSFLLDGLNFEVMRELPGDFPGPEGLIICVDTSTRARSLLGLLTCSSLPVLINIDHHVDNEKFGDLNWVDPTASATGEMVTELLFRSPWNISPEEAAALYVAVVSDNGSFSFASTTLKSHDCAMKLINAGASPKQISNSLNYNLTEGGLRLWGRAMTRVTIFADGLCAIYWLIREDFDETGTTRQATENLVNFLLRIKGVAVAALCCEFAGPDDAAEVRASIRTRAPFSARAIASVFGGGGHDFASGCSINAPVGDAVSMLKKEMERHVAGLSADR